MAEVFVSPGEPGITIKEKAGVGFCARSRVSRSGGSAHRRGRGDGYRDVLRSGSHTTRQDHLDGGGSLPTEFRRGWALDDPLSAVAQALYVHDPPGRDSSRRRG